MATAALPISIDPTADRPAWLAARRSGIGASEAPAILGVSPYSTPLDVYAEKVGAAPEREPTEAMAWGLRLEPVLADAYAERTGFSFSGEQVFLRSEQYPFMLATLDRVRSDGRPVELKTIGERAAASLGIGDEHTDDIPESWLVQALHQMVVSGSDAVDFAVLIGGREFRVFTVERRDRIAAILVEREAEFWARVERRDPPPPSRPGDADHIARIYREPRAGLNLGAEGAALVERYEALGQAGRQADDERSGVRLKLLEILGPFTEGTLPDGRTVKRSLVETAPRMVKGSSYVRLSISKAKGSQ